MTAKQQRLKLQNRHNTEVAPVAFQKKPHYDKNKQFVSENKGEERERELREKKRRDETYLAFSRLNKVNKAIKKFPSFH